MMKNSVLYLGLAAVFAGCAASPKQEASLPTVERVRFVQECMRTHPGPNSEMVAKCSCVLDRLSEELGAEQFDALSTEAAALSIGGERGGVLRDNEAVQKDARRYRDLRAKANRTCMIQR